MTVIETPRLRLRPYVSDDAAVLFAYFGDPEVRRFLPRPPHPYRMEHATAFVASRPMAEREGTEVSRAIEIEGALAGGIGWRTTERVEGVPEGTPSIGFWLARHRWGQGYMTEAARGICAHLIDARGHALIASGAFEENAASLAIQWRLGFQPLSRETGYSPVEDREMPVVRTLLTAGAFARA